MSTLSLDDRSALRRLDEARLGPFHTRLLLVTGFCWLWAGFAVTVVGYIIPVLRGLWPVNATQLGLIASATMAGMAPGSVLAGVLSDRIGRRATLAWTMVYLSLTSLACALAWNYPSLLALRFVSGIGMGAVLPAASTLVSEYCPARNRGGLLVLLNGFWGLGGVVSALVGYGLIPRFGWKAGLLCGALAILTLPLVLRYVPESLRFLIGH
ncbi:MAG TPA: MFS transporter, partial [Anaerolineaceae bacterium]|nr:MFS transporter [Anaerolineaceae bacterium]